jgi:hypothetical protein
MSSAKAVSYPGIGIAVEAAPLNVVRQQLQ